MSCPVCGLPEAGDVCGRCGTDARALSGGEHEARLEIVPVASRGPDKARRT